MFDLPIVEAVNPQQPLPEKVRSLGTISRLLSYPDDHYVQFVELLYLLVQSDLPEAAKGMSAFGQFAERCDEHELEEAYTRTFDVNPSCALEIGWHLFGEDYTRGQFLVRMRGELAKYEIPESGELPDHLTHVLAVIAAMPDEEAHKFSHACVFPALYKMQAALDKNDSPYRHLIRCLVFVLEDYYGASEPWDENDGKILRNSDAFPGQNGPRPPGMGDPLRSYPMPASQCGDNVEFVPLQMQYKPPETGEISHRGLQ
ncbi:MAG: nitrate reductase molybdenum cofactor assembly chaperone [Pirellulales bacterium]|nr:nitrate reductase molybdenum cofactor assembly chaperone [Pirellulales bacterium]